MTLSWLLFLGIWVVVAVIVALFLARNFRGNNLGDDEHD
jgi:hypothetical protein